MVCHHQTPPIHSITKACTKTSDIMWPLVYFFFPLQQHRTGVAHKIWNLSSESEIKQWIEERKRQAIAALAGLQVYSDVEIFITHPLLSQLLFLLFFAFLCSMKDNELHNYALYLSLNLSHCICVCSDLVPARTMLLLVFPLELNEVTFITVPQAVFFLEHLSIVPCQCFYINM